MFLANHWYCAAASDEIGRTPFGRIFLNEPVVMYRKEDGTPVALDDRCCHRRAPLHRGAVEGDNIRCGYHGLVFNSAGTCIWAPGQDRIPAQARVRTYPLCERHGWIWIWMGDATIADESLVPDFHQNRDPNWAAVGGYVHIKSDYRLLIDNLMDLSHVAFLHTASIGSAEDLNPDLSWERNEHFVRGTRIARNISPSPQLVEQGVDFRIDQHKTMTYTVPANILIDARNVEAGHPLSDPGRLNMRLLVFNMMTPETDTSSHYYWGDARNYSIDDEKISTIIKTMVDRAFREDQAMIEAQQRWITLDPAAPTVDIRGDAGGLQSRRILHRHIVAEGLRVATAP